MYSYQFFRSHLCSLLFLILPCFPSFVFSNLCLFSLSPFFLFFLTPPPPIEVFPFKYLQHKWSCALFPEVFSYNFLCSPGCDVACMAGISLYCMLLSLSLIPQLVPAVPSCSQLLLHSPDPLHANFSSVGTHLLGRKADMCVHRQ